MGQNFPGALNSGMQCRFKTLVAAVYKKIRILT